MLRDNYKKAIFGGWYVLFKMYILYFIKWWNLKKFTLKNIYEFLALGVVFHFTPPPPVPLFLSLPDGGGRSNVLFWVAGVLNTVGNI